MFFIGALQKHIWSIHEKAQFPCDQCDKLFSTPSARRSHIKVVHLGIKPHRCHICSRKFAEKKKMRNHIKTVHEGIKDYKCELCDKAFTQLHNLKIHKMGAHQEINLENSEKNSSENI